MKVTLTHDGKSVELDLTAEQMTALGLKEEKKKTGYERVAAGEDCFKVFGDGSVTKDYERYSDLDAYYTGANYYSDRNLAEANARADRLMRQLRRFAAENGGIPSVKNWATYETNKYEIYYSYKSNTFDVNKLWSARSVGTLHFTTEKAARKAIEQFHDELIWYFIEYEAMLR